MTYTWGYIKENALSKLNINEEEANQLNMLSHFPYYANEAMTQICSIKPWCKYIFIETTKINEMITMPEDFISFSDDITEYCFDSTFEEVGDEYIQYCGYNQIICKEIGIYKIPYNARWFFFKDLENSIEIPVPMDILDAIPSYIASQCFKVDDEAKSAIYRNEYEMFLARIDNTSFKSQRKITVAGGW